MNVDKRKQRRKVRKAIRLLENRCCGFCLYFSERTEDNVRFECTRSGDTTGRYWSVKTVSKKFTKIVYKNYVDYCNHFERK